MSSETVEQRPTYGSEEVRKLRETIASQARIIEGQSSARIKCAVEGCENHSDEGLFRGLLCNPCHSFIAGDKKVFSQAYRNARKLAAEIAPTPWGFHMQFNNGREATFKGFEHLAECESHQESGETITMLFTGPRLPVLTDRVH